MDYPADVTKPLGDPLLDSWVRSLRAQRKAVGTITSYVGDVRRFARVAGVEPAAATRADIEAYLVSGHEQGRSEATVARWFRSLQQLYAWLEDLEEIDVSPMRKMSPPKVGETLPPMPSTAEVEALLKACSARRPGNERFVRDRDTALVLLLAYNGARAGELMGLQLADLDLTAGSYRVLGKGSRQRDLALVADSATALDRYLLSRRHHPQAALPWLWLGDRGRGRFTYWGLRQMLERRCAEAEIGDWAPHSFRHRWTHEAKSRGMSDEAIMDQAGWTTTQMLHRYGRSARSERAQAELREKFDSL